MNAAKPVGGIISPPADVHGFYARLGVELPRSRRRSWADVRCFLDGHDDRHPSAGVNLESGGWRCHACNRSGGAYHAALERGLSRRDAAELAQAYGLWLGEATPRRPRSSATGATRPGPSEPEQAAAFDWEGVGTPLRVAVQNRREYVYANGHGEPLYRTVREELEDGTKRLWQEQLDGEAWKPGLGAVERVLYRLPVVLAQAARGGLVFVVEGEKVADGLARLGLVATTAPLGAGKWRAEYAEALAGAFVVVCPDCDLAGRRHAVQASSSCLERGIRVLGPLELYSNLQDGFDLDDYLAELAETVRAVSPELSREAVRERLRAHVLRLVRACLPAAPETLARYLERAEFTAEPRGRVWRRCERCERERAHTLAAGVHYCPCGAVSV